MRRSATAHRRTPEPHSSDSVNVRRCPVMPLQSAIRTAVLDVGSPVPRCAARSATAAAWGEFLARGDEIPSERVESSIDAGSPEDISDVIFTSGTTRASCCATARASHLNDTLRSFEDVGALLRVLRP